MAEAKSHPLFSHAQPGQGKKAGFGRTGGKGMDGLWLAWECPFFWTHTSRFSVSLGLETLPPPLPRTFPAPAGPHRAGHCGKMWNQRIIFTCCMMGDKDEVTLLQNHKSLNQMHTWSCSTCELSPLYTPLSVKRLHYVAVWLPWPDHIVRPQGPEEFSLVFPLKTGHVLDFSIFSSLSLLMVPERIWRLCSHDP